MDAILVFDLIHHESASQRAQAIDRSQHVQDKFLIVLHIGSVYLEQIVIVAGYVIALRDLRDILDDRGKFLRDILVQPGQSHATKHDETLIQLLRIQYGYVFFYITIALQSFKPLKHGSRR